MVAYHGKPGGFFPAASPIAFARTFGSLPSHTLLRMPALSPTMTQGNIAAWHKKEGDKIKPGDALCDIETDKATLAFEMVDDGIVARILQPSGAKDIRVGSPVAVIVEEAADVAAFKDFVAPKEAAVAEPGAPAAPKAAAAAAPAPPPPPPAALVDPSTLKIGPAVRFMMEEAHTPLGLLTPTGFRGFVTREDALRAIDQYKKGGKAPAAAPAAAAAAPAAKAAAKPAPAPPAPSPSAPLAPPTSGHTDTPNSNVRRVIARRLIESKMGLPHVYQTMDITLDALADVREALKARGTAVSVNDLVLKAAALALRDVPAANASWNDAAAEPAPYPTIDISVAVATPNGLITPIVKDADKKSVFQISTDVKDLAKRAREGKLKPEEFIGGSFSVSNLGMYGMHDFKAILNPPQACILAVGGPQQRVVLRGGRPQPQSFLSVTLSADQRVVGQDTGPMLLQAIKRYLETPALLLEA